MKIARTVAEVRALLHGEVGLVPTMGALHDGHLSLLRAARAENELVVASLFVNAAQFGEQSDLDAYPRDEAADAELAEATGVDVLFAASAPGSTRARRARRAPPARATSVASRPSA